MNRIEKAERIMRALHNDMRHESGIMMTDRIQGIVDKIKKFYDGEDKEDVMIVGYLQSAFDRKYITPKLLKKNDSLPFDFTHLQRMFGYNVARMVFELSREPDSKPLNQALTSLTTMDLAKQRLMNCRPDTGKEKLTEAEIEAKALALWASDLPQPAKIVLLAQKAQDFETTAQKPNESKSLHQHKEFYQAQTNIVDALKDVCPAMYEACIRTKENGLKNIATLERSVIMEQQKLQNDARI